MPTILGVRLAHEGTLHCLAGATRRGLVRITRKVFHDLAIWKVGFGLCIGLAFPFFVMMLGVPRDDALTPVFFAACLGAGALAGVVNYVMARRVVGVRLRVLVRAHDATSSRAWET